MVNREKHGVRGGEGKKGYNGEERAQMQVLNDHVAALCASESLKALLFLLPSFKCNVITLLTC
jgi:hypothetical protein